MIDVVFKKENQNLVSYSIKGHADRKASGDDIYLENYDRETGMVYDDAVCSAVSVLGQVCILGMENILHMKVKYLAEEGHIGLNLKDLSLDDLNSTQVLMKTTLLGFENLAESYSSYIKVSVEEV